MANKTVLAGLVGLGILTGCGSSNAADSMKSETVAASTTENGCVVSNIAANRIVDVKQKVRSQYVYLQWSSIDNCTGQQISAGTGRAPFEIMRGSYATGEIYLNFDSATLRDVSKAGLPVIVGLIFTKTPNRENTTTSSDTTVIRVPAPTKTTRVTRKTNLATASIQGSTTFADFMVVEGSIGRSEETLRN